MSLDLVTTFYHGTIYEIKTVDVNAGKGHKDFGKGFYMAASKQQAVGMMHKKYREESIRHRQVEEIHEHLYEIKLNENELNQISIKVFQKPDMEWLEFVLMCREKGGVPHNYDMVVGATADDNMALCLKVYDQGGYGEKGTKEAKNTLLYNLKAENLGIQYYIGEQAVADKVIESVCEIDWR